MTVTLESEAVSRPILAGAAISPIVGQLLLVCFTERAPDIVRRFSARPATRKERQDYEENARS